MKSTLLIFVLGLSLHAGPVFTQTVDPTDTGTGVYDYGWGWGNPEFSFNLDGVSCDRVGGYGCFGSTVNISLQPITGAQAGEIDVAGVLTGFDVFGTITELSCTWDAPGFPNVCQETFSFSPVAESAGFIFLDSGSSGADRVAVPEPAPWLLTLAGIVVIGLLKSSRARG